MVFDTPIPRVSVLMSVYNGEPYLALAIESILRQTFTDFEFIIVDDASTDRSAAIAESFTDPRVVVVRNETNLQVSRSMNAAMNLARGEYLARMDCDDLSLPTRLERQVEFLDVRPDVGICGTWVRTMGQTRTVWRYPTDPEQIQAALLFRSVIAHPTVMMRADFLRRYGLRYRDDQFWAEDWDLWQRASFCFPLVNLPEVLLTYRVMALAERPPEQRPFKEAAYGRLVASRMIEGQLANLQLEYTAGDVELHWLISTYAGDRDPGIIDRAEVWLDRLKAANDKCHRYPEPAFSRALGERWFHVCYGFAYRGPWVFRRFLESPWHKLAKIESIRWLKFATKMALRKR